MSNRKRLTTRVVRPYLSTSEAMKVSDVTRSTLRHYASVGIVHSLDRTDSDYNRWTFDQMIDLGLIQRMRANGMSLEEIAQYTTDKTDICNAAYLSSVQAIRENRRALKSIVHLRRHIERFSTVGIREGYYLRYLPQRWMALIPSAENVSQLLDMDDYIDQFINLKSMVSVVGWSPSYSDGTIVSMGQAQDVCTIYTFCELSSPPMPQVTGSRIVDGGCYKVVCPEQCPECSGAQCEECARFGRQPTENELFAWNAVDDGATSIDRNATSARIKRPYLTGMWADCLAGKLEAQAFDSTRGSDGFTGKNNLPSVIPRLMPQEFALPLCVTACVLPAGIYLCHQNDFEDRNSVMQQMMGIASLMSAKEVTPELELAMAEELLQRSEAWRQSGKDAPGPYVEPFAAPRDFGDPNLAGYVKDVSMADLSRISLLTGTAFPPEDGFLAVHTSIPAKACNGTFRQEFQILVDPGKL